MPKRILLFICFVLIIASPFSLTGCSSDPDIEESGYFQEEPFDYYMNFYISRSPYGLNWESPSTLARTLLKNAIPVYLANSHTLLGHVNYELFAKGKETIYAGMGYYSDTEGFKVIFRDKVGLGLLYHNMAGEFDTEDNLKYAKKAFLDGKTSIITFTFNEERYEQLKIYLDAYLQKGEQFNYGLDNNPFLSSSKGASQDFIEMFPQNKEGIPLGAGCTAFGVSSLQELGIDDIDAYKSWYSKARPPEELIGQYSDQIYSSREERENLFPMNRNTGKKVSMSQIIFRGKSWAEEDEPGKDIIYYCPDLMFKWVAEVAAETEVGEELLSGRLISIENAPRQEENLKAYRLTIALD